MTSSPPVAALAETLRPRLSRQPHVALVFGSGLGSIVERIELHLSIPYADLPPLVATNVDGHAGRLLVGCWAGCSVLAFAGRNHFYEGHSWDTVLAPVHLAAALGVRQLLLTNAAGGIRDDLEPGTLMAIAGHLDWTRPCPWRETIRPNLYSPRAIQLLQEAASGLGERLAVGTYAGVLGPNYETPAEIHALRFLGADAVGMSTTREVEAAFELGLECAAVSCITNRAAGLSPHRLSHQDVLDMSARQARRLGDLIEAILKSLAA